nr:hypothetical protein [Tanacetum cinerariifolium]
MDSNPSQPLVSTTIDTGMYKEDQQATGGPTSLGVTSEARSNPQLSSGKRASSIARQVKEDESSRTINDKDEEADKVHATTNVETEDTLVPKSSSPNSLPTELKDLPSKFNELAEEVKELKKQVHELEIELLEDLKEIPSKLEDFTKSVTSLTSQVAELKTLYDFDDETHITGSMVETSRIKKAKKFDFVTKDETRIHLTEEQINQQKKIEEEAKAKAATRESKDFVSIKDLKDFLNTMLYTVQEIFFRHNQCHGLDDQARTFSSLLLAEVDKRNLNPLNQIRVIEQLGQ